MNAGAFKFATVLTPLFIAISFTLASYCCLVAVLIKATVSVLAIKTVTYNRAAKL
jgi:hypothetical protein